MWTEWGDEGGGFSVSSIICPAGVFCQYCGFELMPLTSGFMSGPALGMAATRETFSSMNELKPTVRERAVETAEWWRISSAEYNMETCSSPNMIRHRSAMDRLASIMAWPEREEDEH